MVKLLTVQYNFTVTWKVVKQEWGSWYEKEKQRETNA